MSENNRRLFLDRHDFILNLPERLAQKISKNDPDDPLLLQFVPHINELSEEGLEDPVDDLAFQKSPKLLQKYKSRALMITTSACAMHCRYCFRKNYPYLSSDFINEIELINKDTSLEEILLSGGDPLSLSDDSLFDLLDQLEAIAHIQRIRFHTRFPIGIPERIHEGFLKKISSYKKQIIFVIHVNHVRELDQDILDACRSLLAHKIPVLTQTVLLKGINDSVKELRDLFLRLVNHGIIPYYLHQLDRVKGSLHFEVDPQIGLDLIEELRNQLPGYAIPEYVQEIAHKSSKTPLHSLKSFNCK